MAPLDLGFSHGFQSPRSAMGTAQRDWQGTEISQPSSPADKEGCCESHPHPWLTNHRPPGDKLFYQGYLGLGHHSELLGWEGSGW